MISTRKYKQFYEESVTNMEGFWSRQASKLVWTKPWDQVLEKSDSLPQRWFVGGEMNACFNLLDRHVIERKGERIALYYDSQFTGEKKSFTYSFLHQQVSKLGTVLRRMGVDKGSVVVICLPRMAETIITMLACARIGAIYCYINASSAPKSLAVMIQHAQPSLIVTTTIGMMDKFSVPIHFKRTVEEAVSLATTAKPKFLIVKRESLPEDLRLEQEKVLATSDVLWNVAISTAEPCDCVPMEANEPLHISYTSGTTGEPKGVVMTSLRLVLTAAREELDNDSMTEDSVFFSPKEMNVTPAHFNLLYRAFYSASTALLYEGDLSGEKSLDLIRLVEEYQVSTIVTSFRSFTDLRQQVSLTDFTKRPTSRSLKGIEVGGEVNDRSLMKWLANFFGCAVTSGYGQTEMGIAIGKAILDDVGSGNKAPQVQTSVLPTSGFSVKVLRTDGKEAAAGEEGRLLLRLPLPPGAFTSLWKNRPRYIKDYFSEFPGFYDTCDNVKVDGNGSFCITGRADDAILVAGARIMPALIEDVVRLHPSVLECCVGPVHDEKYGEVPYALYTTADPSLEEAHQEAEIVDIVRKTLGEVIRFRGATRVATLPKTGHEKIQRKILKNYFQAWLGKLVTTNGSTSNGQTYL